MVLSTQFERPPGARTLPLMDWYKLITPQMMIPGICISCSRLIKQKHGTMSKAFLKSTKFINLLAFWACLLNDSSKGGNVVQSSVATSKTYLSCWSQPIVLRPATQLMQHNRTIYFGQKMADHDGVIVVGAHWIIWANFGANVSHACEKCFDCMSTLQSKSEDCMISCCQS